MSFEDMIADQSEQVKKIAIDLRQLILEIHPRITESIHGGAKVKLASYYIGSNFNVVAVISPSKDHCKLYLHHFDKIDLLGWTLHGKGKHSRHLKIDVLSAGEITSIQNILKEITDIVLIKANNKSN